MVPDGGVPAQDVVLENLLLRHQLAVLPVQLEAGPQARLRLEDKQLLWILARRFLAGWRERVCFVTPETVVRWHRRDWRLSWRGSTAPVADDHISIPPQPKMGATTGTVRWRPVLNGLHHVYERAA
jgi:hypothetical protein